MIRGDAVQLLKFLPDCSIHSFVTDPPYGINLNLNWSGKDRTVRGDGKLEARTLWRRWIPEAHRAAKPNTGHAVFGTWKSPWMHAVLAHTFKVKGCIVWDKKTIGLGYHLRPRWELIYFCAKGMPRRRGVSIPDVWEHPRLMRTRHPCEKPIDLMRRAVTFTTNVGDVVCDPFAGIASTGVAALAEGRRFIGVEIDRRYLRLAQQRLEIAAREAKTGARAGARRAP
ncbi:MAG: site-specific DNA-methyltransferase [Anaerolineae bacterium]|nr:site-specific DNA-methyltransferase [Phycisphaerae bacterium]